MTTLTHPVYGLRLCANNNRDHKSVFMIRTIKEGNTTAAPQQVELPLNIKVVNADAESVGRATLAMTETPNVSLFMTTYTSANNTNLPEYSLY